MTSSEPTRDDTRQLRTRTRSPWATVAVAVAAAVLVNLLVYLVGRLVGGSFAFTAGGQTMQVNALTVAGFSAVPLGVGLSLVTLLAPRFGWVVPAATIVAPLLAVVTIIIMTLPADLDGVSTATLAACHLTLAPISVLAVRTIGAGVAGTAAMRR